jgi:hypothetical protein
MKVMEAGVAARKEQQKKLFDFQSTLAEWRIGLSTTSKLAILAQKSTFGKDCECSIWSKREDVEIEFIQRMLARAADTGYSQ